MRPPAAVRGLACGTEPGRPPEAAGGRSVPARMWDVIRELIQGGTTLLLTTQYLEEADRLADDVVVIDRGRALAQGKSDQLKRQVGGGRIEVTVLDPIHVSAAQALLRRLALGEVAVGANGRSLTAPVAGGAMESGIRCHACEPSAVRKLLRRAGRLSCLAHQPSRALHRAVEPAHPGGVRPVGNPTLRTSGGQVVRPACPRPACAGAACARPAKVVKSTAPERWGCHNIGDPHDGTHTA